MTRNPNADGSVLLFDLDNTLYPRGSGLLCHLDNRINAYLQNQLGISDYAVDELRQRYVREYGTTLRGCQIEHGIDPLDYIARTHDVDPRQYLCPDEAVQRTLRELPGLKVVFSNSPRVHVVNVLSALHLSDLFEKAYTIEFVEYEGKPSRTAYDKVLADLGVDPRRCTMIEDTAVNLVVPHEIGMTTVLVCDDLSSRPNHVDHVVQRLPDLLTVFAGARDEQTAV